MAKGIWGVYSAAKATSTRYQCVSEKYGKPAFWGRYLKTVPGVSEGLTKEEITFLHEQSSKIIPIQNNFQRAQGYNDGVLAAIEAIRLSESLGFPKNTAIFANIEFHFTVDYEWIRGWVHTFSSSGYLPGLYGDPVRGKFNLAYCIAASHDEMVKSQTIVWSSQPKPGATKASEAPDYKPTSPNCSANVFIWQYGEGAPSCEIDTDLADPRALEHMW
jgi:hypothetical protein